MLAVYGISPRSQFFNRVGNMLLIEPLHIEFCLFGMFRSLDISRCNDKLDEYFAALNSLAGFLRQILISTRSHISIFVVHSGLEIHDLIHVSLFRLYLHSLGSEVKFLICLNSSLNRLSFCLQNTRSK